MGNGSSFEERRTQLTVRRVVYPPLNWLGISSGGLAWTLILVLANSSIGTGLIISDGRKVWDPSCLPGYGNGGLGSNIKVFLSQQIATDHCNLSMSGLSA